MWMFCLKGDVCWATDVHAGTLSTRRFISCGTASPLHSGAWAVPELSHIHVTNPIHIPQVQHLNYAPVLQNSEVALEHFDHRPVCGAIIAASGMVWCEQSCCKHIDICFGSCLPRCLGFPAVVCLERLSDESVSERLASPPNVPVDDA